MQTKPKIVRADAYSLTHNTEPALVVVEIAREDIESGNLASSLERLQILTDTVENTRLYRESVMIIVDGYNEDPRELVEIPEVRDFFRNLNGHWPYWLWFLSRDMGAIGLILSLLCKVGVRHADGKFSTEFDDITEVTRKMQELFHRSNPLFEAYGITENEVLESAGSALKELRK